MRSFPSYRFHPDGLMALIHCEDDHKSLLASGWQETLPENFLVPPSPHYHKIDDVPATHKGDELGSIVQPSEESAEESDHAEEDEGTDMVVDPVMPDPEVQAAEEAIKAVPKIDRKVMTEDEKRKLRAARVQARTKRTKLKASKKEAE